MNNLYIYYMHWRKTSKMRFVGVLECRSGFFKIYFKKIARF